MVAHDTTVIENKPGVVIPRQTISHPLSPTTIVADGPAIPTVTRSAVSSTVGPTGSVTTVASSAPTVVVAPAKVETAVVLNAAETKKDA